METQPKFNNSKEVIAYLAEQFPLCFIAEGEAKPLKIGIFQDIVKRLENDSRVSKTQLRSALRLYTTSWRYLYGIKVGAERVDLDGNSCGVLEQEHVDFARQQLEQAKQKVKEQRKDKKDANPLAEQKSGKPKARVAAKKSTDSKKDDSIRTAAKAGKASQAKPKSAKPAVAKQVVEKQIVTKPLSAAEVANLKPGQMVKVRAGKDAMDATLLEISKEGARVQLASGMSLVVRPEHLVV